MTATKPKTGRPSPIPVAPGLRFGRLTVIKQARPNPSGLPRWKCRCDCGNVSYPTAGSLRSRTAQSCGCLRKENARKARAIDLTGQRFGRLTVIERAGLTSAGSLRWKCQCDCGNISHPRTASLRNKTTKSCGCLQKDAASKHNAKDITGQRFGRLTALHPVGKGRDRLIVWRLRCDCGKNIDHTIRHLGGDTQSCGCLRREKARQFNYRHGGTRGGVSSLYACWLSIKNRCFNPKNAGFKNYGGRGISMAREWIGDFPAFRDYVSENLGPKPKGYTIDRIENNEGYFPGNIQWATRTTQGNNTRRTIVNTRTDAILAGLVSKSAAKRRREARP